MSVPSDYEFGMHWQLLDGGELELVDDFVAVTERTALLAELQSAIAWQRRSIRSFGRWIVEPRETAWIGDPDAVYTYSGRVNEPTPWPPVVRALCDRVSARAEHAFNAVLCNLYANGQDSMGLHSDSEPELGENPVIASLSLGATRRFQLRHRKLAHERLDLDLSAGSLLIMRGTLQSHYRHGVPKQAGVLTARINLTFRRIVAVADRAAAR
jgi:alkylated DNA repair dioxygenase AlkB